MSDVASTRQEAQEPFAGDADNHSKSTDAPSEKHTDRERAKEVFAVERKYHRRMKKKEAVTFDLDEAAATARTNARNDSGAAFGNAELGPTISTNSEAHGSKNWKHPSHSIYGKAANPDKLAGNPPSHAKANHATTIELEMQFKGRLANILEWPRLRPAEAFFLPPGLLPALANLASHNKTTKLEVFQGHLHDITAARDPKFTNELTKREVEAKDLKLSMEMRDAALVAREKKNRNGTNTAPGPATSYSARGSDATSRSDTGTGQNDGPSQAAEAGLGSRTLTPFPAQSMATIAGSPRVSTGSKVGSGQGTDVMAPVATKTITGISDHNVIISGSYVGNGSGFPSFHDVASSHANGHRCKHSTTDFSTNKENEDEKDEK